MAKIEVLDKNNGKNSQGYICCSMAMTLKNGYRANFKYDSHPTCNCQVFAISPLEGLLNTRVSLEEFHELLQFIKSKFDFDPHQLLFDVNEGVLPSLKKLINGVHDIVFEHPYLSTNGSFMVMGLIRIDEEAAGIDDVEDDDDEEFFDDDDDDF